MTDFPFRKYQGAGNDFILLEGRYLDPSVVLSQLAISLCDRRKGIGADGLLILGPSAAAHFRMRIFNADGSEPAMCGNGAYCLATYIDRVLEPFSHLALETKHAVLHFRKADQELVLNLGPVSIQHFPLYVDGVACYVVNTGVPHAIIWEDNLDEIDVEKRGRELRFHPQFAPEGVNVNFVKLGPQGLLHLRTYERGVEGETLACGTGAAAAAFVAAQLHRMPSPLRVATRSHFAPGSTTYTPLLRFLFSKNEAQETEIEMIGSAQEVFEGMLTLSESVVG